MECYPAIKNKFMSFAEKWMDLENITLSEISQSQNVKGHVFYLISGSYRVIGIQERL